MFVDKTNKLFHFHDNFSQKTLFLPCYEKVIHGKVGDFYRCKKVKMS